MGWWQSPYKGVVMNHNESFTDRNKTGINESEIKCEEWMDNNNIFYDRFGFDLLNKISMKKFMLIPEVLRNKPDYLAIGQKAVLIESKGCNDVLGLKKCDMVSYDWGNDVLELRMFLYSKSNQETKQIKYTLLKEIALKCEVGVYHDNGKEYYKINWGDIMV